MDAVKGGVYYFSTEKIPFKNMQVGDFVAYSRSLFDGYVKDEKSLKALLKSVGYNGSRRVKLGKVGDEDFVKVLLASKLKTGTEKVYINVDRWKYNKVNVKKVRNLMGNLRRFDLFFLVSDFRFCTVGGNCLYQTQDDLLLNLGSIEQRKRASKSKVGALIKSAGG
jgi:hypothetical protein